MPALMRKLCILPVLLVCPWPCGGWDTPPHQQITRAAVEALPKALLSRLGSEVKPLIDIYCIYPDRYEEMEHYGFVRNSPGPKSASAIRIYCVRPDGHAVHGATGDRELDTTSLVYLLTGIAGNLAEQRPAEAAQYIGVLAHFIEDSLSPPHAAGPEELLGITLAVAPAARRDMHSAIEKSIPDFALQNWAPRPVGNGLLAIAKATLEECYSGVEMNRKNLPEIVKAAVNSDERTLDAHRVRAGKRAAAILANAIYAVFDLGHGGR